MNAVQRKREARGLTVPQMARLAGVSTATWLSAEAGNDLKRDTKRRMLKALRVPFHRNGEYFPMEPYTPARFDKLAQLTFDLMARGLAEAQFEIEDGKPGTALKGMTPLQWSLQGFGMLRYYLPGTTRRVHVWGDHVSDMHTHPWNFTSTVLSGRLENEIYVKDPIVGEGSKYYRQKIKTGPGRWLEGDPEEVWMGLRSVALYTPGQRYRQDFEQIHVSKPSHGCVTICEREVPADYAFVYWREDEQWGTAEPRPATPEEREAILGNALRQWGE